MKRPYHTHKARDSDTDFQRQVRLTIRMAGGTVDALLAAIPVLRKGTVHAWLRRAKPLIPSMLIQFSVEAVMKQYREKKRTQARVARMELEG